MPRDPTGSIVGLDDPHAVFEALGSAFAQLAYSVATVDREFAAACLKDTWTKINKHMAARGFSERDRLAVLAALDYAEREIAKAARSRF